MQILGFDSLPSTNTYAKEHIKDLSHKDVITAKTQNAGRGRMQRIWLSEEGGLYFSVVLKPHNFELRPFCSFTLAMALAVCETLKSRKVAAYIKWPNDVLCDGRKLCGILSECVLDQNGALLGIVVGAGINLSQPKLLCDKPAVTLKELGFNFDSQALLEEICSAFDGYYSRIMENGFAAIRGDFKAALCALGNTVTLRTAQGVFTGILRDITEEGLLALEAQDGGVKEIAVGDMDF